jgi:3-deoxy-D-manno-octulosonate 8-phosphate phosphatase (KDO 8-P phosphatase)
MPAAQFTKISPAAWSRVALFAMDVDGILTDGTIHVSADGAETKTFSVLDGLGLVRLAAAGVATAWISGRHSGATTVRGAELKIPHLIQGKNDKLSVLRELAAQLRLDPSQIAYMGDDDIDAPALAWAGIGVSVPTAMPSALAAADYVTTRPAGLGAVREICDLILAARRDARNEK